jgi:hypothetical protein
MNLVDRYLWFGSRRVDGWLNPFSARFIVALARAQITKGICGAAAEIGVHHGRLFILMHLASPAGQKDIAIDIFDDQQLNRDHSGRGDLARFLDNLERLGGRSTDVVIVQQSSLELKSSDILRAVGHVRLFSVDGGHTEECVMNDLNIAQSVLCKGGVLVLDDFFNEYWPEVAVGTLKFLTSGASRLRPFAITPGKTYLAGADDCNTLLMLLEQIIPMRYYDKACNILGSEVRIYGSADSRASSLCRLRYAAAETKLGVTLRRVKRRLISPGLSAIEPKAYHW